MTSRIICANAMDWLEQGELDELVDLVVTSPPYDDLRAYQGYEFDYQRMLAGIYRTLSSGGVCVWIVGDQSVKGDRTLSSFRHALAAKEIGYRAHDVMIWQKPNPCFAGQRRYTNCFEYMFVFSKGKPATFNGLRTPTKNPGKHYPTNQISYDGGKQIAPGATGRSITIGKTKLKHNIWQFSIGKAGKYERIGHPAIMPLELAMDHITSWSNKGDLVLDPMCGTGTTCLAAASLERRWIGIDISNDYCRIARERINAVLLPTPRHVA